MKKLLTITLTLCFAFAAAGTTLAAPPLVTDDAGTVDVGKVEIELNSSYCYEKQITDRITTKTNVNGGEVKITTGLYKDIGISLAIPYTFNLRRFETDGSDTAISNIDGLGDMILEVKYKFVELAGINLAIKPNIIIPTGEYKNGLSEGHWHAGALLIATKEFADGAYTLNLNAGYEHHDYRTNIIRETTHDDIWSVSVAGEAEVVKGLFAVADFGLATNPDKTSNELPVYALTGLRYEINDHLDIDAGIKFGLTKPETDVTALYGLVLKF